MTRGVGGDQPVALTVDAERSGQWYEMLRRLEQLCYYNIVLGIGLEVQSVWRGSAVDYKGNGQLIITKQLTNE